MVYEEALATLAYLEANPEASDHDERVRSLVVCPQPLQNLLSQRFLAANDKMRRLMLEVLTRRYYRIRPLDTFACFTADGQTYASAIYSYQNVLITCEATFARYEELAAASARMADLVSSAPEEHDIVVDFYLWRSTPLGDADG